uniref:glycoside hydrolase family 3 C-terminal domain-containing protein n=1 Tax=Mycolicibacterium psychrotolerans TaxID=216929 RepID=UPI0021F33EDE
TELDELTNGLHPGQMIVEAGEAGTLAAQRVDEAAGRVLRLIERAGGRGADPVDQDAHHALAREAAGRSIVLLRNDGDLLPLRPDTSIAVIGAFAVEPRYQGGGSSKINPTRLDTALDEIRALATGTVTYHPGDPLDDAVAAASAADVAVVFLGLPAAAESEGYDRDGIDLPAAQLALLDAVRLANPRTVVVLSNGGVVALPFAEDVPALLEGWLLGQACGGAVADVLFGVVNPSAKLTETIPRRLQDTPAYLDFPGEHGHVRYGEGLFVGYRWYDARDLDVAFPFGHGLSYTTFHYGDASAAVDDAGGIAVEVSVTNTGAVAGREVVQVYTGVRDSAVTRAPRECKAFVSVPLEPGETREIRLTVRREDLAYWDIRVDGWVVEAGTYTIEVAASSRDVRASLSVDVAGDDIGLPLTRMSSIGEVLAHPVAGPALAEAMASAMPDAGSTAGMMPEGVDVARMLDGIPIQRAIVFAAAGGADVDPAMIDALLEAADRPAD